MRRIAWCLGALVVVGLGTVGCGPKVTEAEKETPVPELYKNPRGYKPPPGGASTGGAPAGAPTGQPQAPPAAPGK